MSNVVRLKGWKWLPGSVCVDKEGKRYRVSDNAGDCYPCNGDNDWRNIHTGSWYPDLNDDATFSNLEECVRRAWGVYAHLTTTQNRCWQLRGAQAPNGSPVYFSCVGTKIQVMTEAIEHAERLDYDPRISSSRQSEFRKRRIPNGPNGEILYGPSLN